MLWSIANSLYIGVILFYVLRLICKSVSIQYQCWTDETIENGFLVASIYLLMFI